MKISSEMPVFDFGQISLTLRRPAAALLLGRSLAERRISNELARSIGPQILRAVSGYRQLAYDWSEKTVGQIQRRFEAYASGYRAQVGRMVGSQELSSEQEQAVRHSLDALQEKRTREPVQASGYRVL